jgi:hypothetical protein
MSHADEVRALLLEAARALEAVGVGPLREEHDGLALRCRRYAEDLAAPGAEEPEAPGERNCHQSDSVRRNPRPGDASMIALELVPERH